MPPNTAGMRVLQILLYPFSLLYGGVMAIRNQLYDRQYFRAQKFTAPVISLGNLTVGGTGKTPHVEYILRLLSGRKIAVLSRGYKRKTKGYVRADATATAATLGDEPFQYCQDFPDVTVAVAEDRAAGIQNILTQQPDLEAVILDDAFQHRGVTPALNILLTDYYRLFFQDFVLPAGRLREFPAGAARADVVLVTKCADILSKAKKENLENAIYRFTRRNVPIYFTRYEYGAPVAIGEKQDLARRILLVTAIAHPQPLVKYLQEAGYHVLKQYIFPDHHAYTPGEVQKIFIDWQRYATAGKVVVFTTRKDAAKLTDPALAAIFRTMPFFYIPVKVTFVENQAGFDTLILNQLPTRSKSEIN